MDTSAPDLDLLDWDTLFAGSSQPIVELQRRLALIAPTSAPVWMHAEVGTGRAILARGIHERSPRRDGALLSVNAVSLPGDQLEEHLFGGVEPGVRNADGGTLFIDGVAELAPGVQAKLLRLIEERRVRLRGIDHPVDVRVIVADERRTMNVGGRLRRELYDRLRSHELDLPPLRERARDLPAIVAAMLQRLPGASLSAAARRCLESYPFPGNAQELAGALAHAHLVAGGAAIDVEHLPADVREHRDPGGEGGGGGDDDGDDALAGLEPLEEVTRRFEREYLLRVLRAVSGNRTRAAAVLGLSRKGLWQKLKAHGVATDEGRGDSDND
ncbi:MAG: sigma-54-dependent Fis family transcriptional regulator [Deltaproteobacteria bacterium]|nr:sigma-54-dependent Fis family transcriptional regulator [Deltaproteobacteria bacterium]